MTTNIDRRKHMSAEISTLTRNLFSGVNKISDPSNPTDLEKKHTPVIDAPSSIRLGECFSVSVEVGKLLAHPNERGHFIEFIDLYADELFLGRVDLTAVNTFPKAVLSVALTSPAEELRAYGRCNIHGTWLGTASIAVAEGSSKWQNRCDGKHTGNEPI
jgi:superoxide reductase